ncbi:MAG: hypothetical protein IPI76_11950 [Chloracidobacterium sp.]|nr:hypothetical protein [Chloracidobacterium sp.]
MSVVFFFVLTGQASAQKKFSKTYPAGQNVRLQLMNRSGTVTVEGWNRSDINISATLEAPAANIVPQNLSGTIVVNLVKDNQGRPEWVTSISRSASRITPRSISKPVSVT